MADQHCTPYNTMLYKHKLHSWQNLLQGVAANTGKIV